MSPRMSPNDIEVLIHCHCSRTVHPRYTANAVSETLKRFLRDGIIRVYSEKEVKGDEGSTVLYETTALGSSLVDRLCAAGEEGTVLSFKAEDGSLFESSEAAVKHNTYQRFSKWYLAPGQQRRLHATSRQQQRRPRVVQPEELFSWLIENNIITIDWEPPREGNSTDHG